MKISYASIKATNEVFKRLNNLQRWRDFRSSGEFNELAKQSQNCIATYMLASYAENAGKQIQWENFPKLAIYRAFQKAYVYFDTPEHIIDQMCERSDIDKATFEKTTKDIIRELTDDEFVEFLSEALDTYESRIYKAATKIATFVELEANKLRIDQGTYCETLQELVSTMERYKDIPGMAEMEDIKGPIFKILAKLSKLRHQNRWAVTSYRVKCSVLGHLFDTGVFAYFMSLEQAPEDEKIATEMFFMGIYHDIAEAWTKDVPSPIKDRIEGFRKATEEFEMHVLERHMYSKVPDFLKQKFKKAMFEDESNAQYKRLIKGADYLSADSECWRQYVAGSREFEYRNAIHRNWKNFEEGKILQTPGCYTLHCYFRKYADTVTKDIPE